MKKELLFSLTKDDFQVQTFRAGGKGGQNQNKRDTGVRIIHAESGAVGESREERSQLLNRRKAFTKLANCNKFKSWHRIKCVKFMKDKSIEDVVEEMMQPENLKVEIRNQLTGKWETK